MKFGKDYLARTFSLRTMKPHGLTIQTPKKLLHLARAALFGLPVLAVLLASPQVANAQVSLDWGVDGGGGTEWLNGGTGNGNTTYANVGGSGVDVRVTVAGASSAGNPPVDDDNTITPNGTDETLLVRLAGGANGPATITIEFFQTNTTTPVNVTNVSLPIFDVDQFPRPSAADIGWTDEVQISASSGGTAVTGVSATGSVFNTVTPAAPQPPTNTSVTAVGNGGNSARDGLAGADGDEDGPFASGTVNTAFAQPLDTITIIYSDGPSNRDEAHAIAIGDIAFTATATPTPAPAVGLAKQISLGPTATATPGVFSITYNLTVENLGNEALNNVQIVEAFNDPITTAPTFGPGNIIASSVGTIILNNGASLTPNAAYNVTTTGVVNTNVLGAGGTLPVGASATIPVTVQVDTTQADFPVDTGNDGYNNQATVSGTGATSNTGVNDISDNGTDPDPDGDGNPNEPTENDPTPASFPSAPAIGVAKQISAVPTATATPGVFSITYNLTVENLGNEALNNVQIVEAFNDPITNLPTFGPGNIVASSVGAITPNNGASLTPNAAYNVTTTGVVDTNVLGSGGTLPVGASATIPITVQVDTTQADFPADGGDGYNNQVTATGTGATSNTGVNDISDNGTDPDPDGDGNPNEQTGTPGDPNSPGNENDPTPVSFSTTPVIGVAKQVSTGPTETTPGSGIFNITYQLTVENLGNEALNNVQIIEAFNDPITNAPTFGPGNIVTSSIGTITPTGGAVLTANTNFNVTSTGTADTNVLAAGGNLPIGASATILINVQVDSTQADFPADGGDGYNNQVTASGTGVTSNNSATDISDNGTDPDPDGDGNPGEQTGTPGDPNSPGNENDPTPISFNIGPSIGLAKQISADPTETATGTGIFDIAYTLTVTNLGNEALNNVQIVEAFNDPITNGPTFGPGNIIASSVGTITPTGGATLTANANYNVTATGTLDTNVLAAGGSLPVGASATILVTVQVDRNQPDFPADGGDGFNNQATVSGTGSTSNTPVNDISDDGTDPDSDDDGNGNEQTGTPGNPDAPGNENDPTPASFGPEPVIGIAKQLVQTQLESTGSFGPNTARVTYDIVVANLGNESLNNVQITEDLNTTFGTGTFQVVSVTRTAGATTLAPDFSPGTFDGSGTSDATMLAAGGSLAVSGSSTFRLVVDVDISSNNLIRPVPGPYDNQAQADAVGVQSNNPTQDLSDDGTQVDPDGDGNPNEDNGNPGDPSANENTPTQVLFGPDLRLTKRITAIIRNGSPVNITGINLFNADDAADNGDDTLNTLSGGNLPLGLVAPDITLQSGDVVEYTIHFWNAGLGTAQNIELCDELQAPSVLIPGSLSLATPTALSLVTSGTALSFNPSSLLSARAPLSPLADSCVSAPGNFPSGVPAGGLGVGAGGGVVVGGPASNLNVAPNEVGAFRFQIRLP